MTPALPTPARLALLCTLSLSAGKAYAAQATKVAVTVTTLCHLRDSSPGENPSTPEEELKEQEVPIVRALQHSKAPQDETSLARLTEAMVPCYVDPLGKRTPASADSFDLATHVRDFLEKSSSEVLLLVEGKSGSGKSIFALWLEKEMCEAWHEGGYMPLYVPLPAEGTRLDVTYVESYLGSFLSEAQLKELQGLGLGLPLLFIMDGLDEMGDTTIDLGARSATFPLAKVLATSRPIEGGAASKARHLSLREDALRTCYVPGFVKKQVQEFVTRFTAHFSGVAGSPVPAGWEVATYMGHLENISRILRDSDGYSPLFMRMAMEVLPPIVAEAEASEGVESLQGVGRKELFERFMQRHFERVYSDWEGEGTPLPESLETQHQCIKRCWHYAMRLAINMNKVGANTFRYNPDSVMEGAGDHDQAVYWDGGFTERGSYLTLEKELAMQALPVYQARGHKYTYKFWHLDLQEFFAASRSLGLGIVEESSEEPESSSE